MIQGSPSILLIENSLVVVIGFVDMEFGRKLPFVLMRVLEVLWSPYLGRYAERSFLACIQLLSLASVDLEISPRRPPVEQWKCCKVHVLGISQIPASGSLLQLGHERFLSSTVSSQENNIQT